MVLFPNPLHAGDLIAVTAPSSGVPPSLHPRLDLVLGHLRARGFRILEGSCLRAQSRSASAPREERAAELTRFLKDPEVAAIIPPWGGELLSELLKLVDFDALRDARPKWVLGYSDTSTLLLPLTLLTGWATAHGTNLMDMVPAQVDPLTTGVLEVLSRDFNGPVDGASVTQASVPRFQDQWSDFVSTPDAPLQLTETTEWKRLDDSSEPLTMTGRLIGGCIDTISLLAGSPYGDVPLFVRGSADNGTILYLENVDQSPGAMVRTLLSLERHRWFDGLSGLVFGRSAAKPETNPDHLGYVGALESVLDGAPFPVLYDVDIGHKPPQLTLINGALAEWSFRDGAGSVVQTRPSSR